MIRAEIEAFLKHRIGLDAASIGSAAIERAVRNRLAACHIDSLDRYLDHLRGSHAEQQELVEEVVVPETWFFRDPGAFEVLAAVTAGRNVGTRNIRLLSVPCSTGEEPYSMAIALLEAGIPPERFAIDAIDVSLRSLERAKRAVYGKNSFRGAELSFRERYFDHGPQGYVPLDKVRDRVCLRHGNIFDSAFQPVAEIYDVIFCRNLLIYFDRPTQDRAVAGLRRLLTPDGLLFVGPAEASLAIQHGFVSMKSPLAFAFRKKNPDTTASKRHAPHATASRRSSQATVSPIRPAASETKPAPQTERADPELSLDEAHRLANQGRLAEAVKYCEAFLHRHGPAAEIFSLLGIIHDSGGDPQKAVSCYRKALYLDPGHRETLTHLALLLERQGDQDAANALIRRAGRLARESVT